MLLRSAPIRSGKAYSTNEWKKRMEWKVNARQLARECAAGCSSACTDELPTHVLKIAKRLESRFVMEDQDFVADLSPEPLSERSSTRFYTASS
eukprot:EC849509.1.p1 GENE.EC849509.1~~EC849509.1.p1  ORF type:complete len:93 (+),score=7.53 EC849509.1:179-457(+)